jgi:hypothetical protein
MTIKRVDVQQQQNPAARLTSGRDRDRLNFIDQSDYVVQSRKEYQLLLLSSIFVNRDRAHTIL